MADPIQLRAACNALRGDLQTALTQRLHAGQREAFDRANEEVKAAKADLLKVKQEFVERASGGFSLLGVDARGDRQPALPVLMFPVRLETRLAYGRAAQGEDFAFDTAEFDPRERVTYVLIRVFPDDIHVNSHEPEFTAEERRLRAQYDEAARVDSAEAWSQLCRKIDPRRAAWLVHGADLDQAGRRPNAWSAPATAELMPDQWFAFIELEDGSSLGPFTSSAVAEPLHVGPDPLADLAGDEGIEWLKDFYVAKKAGMAIVAEMGADPPPVSRIVVVGARGSVDHDASHREIESLIRAHEFTRGIEFIAPGTPTNSTSAGRSPHGEPESADQVRERCLQADPAIESTVATLTALTLGMNKTAFRRIRGARGRWHLQERDLRRVLAALVGANLRGLFSGEWRELLFGDWDAEDHIAELLTMLIEDVSGTGPLPILKVAAQPYGILPISTRLAHHDSRSGNAGGTVGAKLRTIDRLRDALFSEPASGSVAFVSRLGEATGDPSGVLRQVLGRDGIATRLELRPHLLRPLAERLGLSPPAGHPAIFPFEFSAAVAAPLTSGSEPFDQPWYYLYALREMRFWEVSANAWPDINLGSFLAPVPRPPAPLLCAFLRRLVLAQERRNEQVVVGHHPVGDLLSDLGSHGFPEAENRDVLLMAALGLLANRLDAWYTALAWRDLVDLRGLDTLDSVTAAGSPGLNVAAYGVLEGRLPYRGARLDGHDDDGRPRYLSRLGGFVHTPSIGHAATAAVLRSAHLAESRDGRAGGFAIDLSSGRVRSALEILEGVGQGQPLGALLGYRIERHLRDLGRPDLIAPLRQQAPLVAGRVRQGEVEPAESVAAHNVVDGLVALQRCGYPDLEGLAATPLGFSDADAAPVEEVLRYAAGMLDSVADLVVAEGVHQLVNGNAARAAAVNDVLSGAPGAIPEFEVVRATVPGIAAAHRAVVLLDPGVVAEDSPWPPTARDHLAPAIGNWLRAVLPAPSQIRYRVTFESEDATSSETVSLGDLHDLARDQGRAELTVGIADLLAGPLPGDAGHRSPLELRLASLALLARDIDSPRDRVRLSFARQDDWDPTWFSISDVLELVHQIRGVSGPARPLGPGDLTGPGEDSGLLVDLGELEDRVDAFISALGLDREIDEALDGTLAGDVEALSGWLSGPMDDDPPTSGLRLKLFDLDRLLGSCAPPNIEDRAPGDPSRASELLDLEQHAQAVLRRLQSSWDSLASLSAPPRIKLGAEGYADSVPDRLAFEQQRVNLLLGAGQQLVPTLKAALPGRLERLADALGDPDKPTSAEPERVRRWVSSVARIRPRVGAVWKAESVARCVQAVDHDRPLAEWCCIQFPIEEVDAPWVGADAPDSESHSGGRTSVVALCVHGALEAAAEQTDPRLVGLAIDEWAESIPDAERTTALAVHLDVPNTAAPQALLLVVPHERGDMTWTAELARDMVVESLALARLRLVAPEDLARNAFLPAWYFLASDEQHGRGLDVGALISEEDVP